MSLYEHNYTVGGYIVTEYLTDARAADLRARGYYVARLSS